MKNKELNYLANYYSKTWHERYMATSKEDVVDLEDYRDVMLDAIDIFDTFEQLTSGRDTKLFKLKKLLAGVK